MLRSLLLFLIVLGPAAAAEAAAAPASLPPLWIVTPFALLLVCIAVMPVLLSHFWHRWYPAVAVALGALTASYYLFVRGDSSALAHVSFEYLSFIALLTCLYVCSGGIVIGLGGKGLPWSNTLLLLAGGLIANLVGTTGASMLLIRPFLRANRGRLQPYHVVFFIFIVSNVGGALTPIGDPPLLLGFLRGIGFFHFFALNVLPWMLTMALLLALFFAFDSANKRHSHVLAEFRNLPPIQGWSHLGLLGLSVAVVFLDPSKVPWLPAITYHGHDYSFVREVLMFGIAYVAWKTAKPENLQTNAFTLEPIREVAFLFVGIFLTMIPALELIRHAAQGGTILGFPLTVSTFYLGTGLFSGVLDNAPTFVAFLAGMEGRFDMDVAALGHSTDPQIVASLSACACAAVFFGAMTYIGNGPNLMVKAIAESARDANGALLVEVPSLHGYVLKYALPILTPVLLIVWLVFFRV
ncbi:MAG TPA: sodium:proton antiporter [Planctomycetota bacterium]|nr:sodium:proton antiporter [Planctomycetota bacterium]